MFLRAIVVSHPNQSTLGISHYMLKFLSSKVSEMVFLFPFGRRKLHNKQRCQSGIPGKLQAMASPEKSSGPET